MKEGFEIRDGKLVRMVESTIDYVENEGLLLQLLKKYNFSFCTHFLNRFRLRHVVL